MAINGSSWAAAPHSHGYNGFQVERSGLPLLCEKSEAVILVLVGLMAGRPAVR